MSAQHAFLDLAKAYDWAAMDGILRQSHPGGLVDAQPAGRWSALHQAADCGDLQAVKMLLGHGASPLVRNEDGRTPRDLAEDPRVRGMLEEAYDKLHGTAAAPAPAPAPCPDDHMTLRDDDGNEVRFVANSEPIDEPNFNGLRLVLQQPIFFCPRARLVARQQRTAQPVLLLTQHDWQQLKRPDITHEGAFGSDFAVVSAAKIAERLEQSKSSYDPRTVAPPASSGGVPSRPGEVWVCHMNGGRVFYKRPRDEASMTLNAPAADASVREKEEVGADRDWFEDCWAYLNGGGGAASAAPDWVVVWKFPGDLNGIPTFRMIGGVPLPVGCYPFQDDGWWVPIPLPPELPSLPFNCVVEKMRTDLGDPVYAAGGLPCVHHLERPGGSGSGAQVAAITSTYFIKGLWEGQQPATLPQIVAMLRELYALGVYAVPCYGQHHAIVFYADRSGPSTTLLSPQKFCERVLVDEERGTAVLAALQRGALPEKRATVALWRDSYMRVYHHA